MHPRLRSAATRIAFTLTLASSLPIAGLAYAAQIEHGTLYATVINFSGNDLAPGVIELWSVYGNGVEEPFDRIDIEDLADGWQDSGRFFRVPFGRRYRLIYRANCEHDISKRAYFRSESFVWEPRRRWFSLTITDESIEIIRASGRLVRLDIQNAPPNSEIYAKPGDLIELDYMLPGPQPLIAPKGGAHPECVEVSPIGPKPIIVNEKTVGTASYFYAKNRGEDRITVEVDSVPHRFKLFVIAK